MTRQTDLSRVLAGVRAGKLQTVGMMQVIPLLGTSDDRFAPVDGLLAATQDYGRMSMRNTQDRPTVIPSGAGFLTKGGSQDHAAMKARYIQKQARLQLDHAACIEATQGGLIREGQARMIILPVPLREAAFNVRNQSGYNKLWSAIERFNKAAGLDDRGHVNVFLRAFEEQLQKFLAEFEPVDGQVGAIILVAGKPVGIERTPSEAYWLSVWQPLIRECYGSLVLWLQKKGGPLASGRIPLEGEFETIEDLLAALEQVQELEDEQAKDVIRELVTEPMEATVESTDGGFTVESLENEHFVGQVVRDGDQVVYASLTGTESYIRVPYAATRPFEI